MKQLLKLVGHFVWSMFLTVGLAWGVVGAMMKYVYPENPYMAVALIVGTGLFVGYDLVKTVGEHKEAWREYKRE